ncbi:MAG: nusB [Chloroflexi bacterium]|nr:nusB [Chloroflexota bacterium]
MSRHRPAEVLDRLFADLHPDAPVFDYASELVNGVVRHKAEIDRWIVHLAPAWPIDQMSAVDRNLLRLGIFEALYNSSKIPVRVAISEAVELAKLFGSENSSKLINGVLGRAVAESSNHLPQPRSE